MFKKYSKRTLLITILLIIAFSYIGNVLAATSAIYDFSRNDGGMTIAVETNEKVEGKVILKATRETSSRYYRGTFRFVLYKKNLFGVYSEYARKMRNTYNDLNIVESWVNMSKAYYKGTLQLYDYYSTYKKITTRFYIENVN